MPQNQSVTGPVLVTGGAGFIGSAVVAELLRCGAEVVVLDDLSRGHADAVPADVPLVVGNILDPAAIEAATRAKGLPCACIHLAGLAYVAESFEIPAEYFKVNAHGTLTLASRLLELGVKRLVFSSSCTVYAPTESGLISERSALGPISPYGESKRQAESILGWLAATHPGFRWATLRYFNASGATAEARERHDPETHILPLILRSQAVGGAPLRVYGTDYDTADGTCERDYVHVADLARAHVLALRALDGAPHLALNLGGGVSTSILALIREVERQTQRAVPWQAGPRRIGDAARLVADVAEADRVLGWRPERSGLAEIVRDAARYLSLPQAP
jgi:UDP-arabinose 4-epimerase